MRIFTLSITTLLFVIALQPADAIAATSDQDRSTCITSLGLTEEQLASGLFDYKVDRCLAAKRRRAGRTAGLKRLNKRIQRRSITGAAAGARYNRNNFGSSVLRITKDGIQEEYRRDLQQQNLGPRRQRNTSVQRHGVESVKNDLRKQRLSDAREACKDVSRGMRNNCINNYIRAVGSGREPIVIAPRPVRRISARHGLQNTNTKEAKHKRALLIRDRAQKAREACTDSPRSQRKNCVRNELRRLGRMKAVETSN